MLSMLGRQSIEFVIGIVYQFMRLYTLKSLIGCHTSYMS